MGLTSPFRQPKQYLTSTAWELRIFISEMGKVGYNLNTQEHMSFPFWIIYDSEERKMLKTESSGIADRITDFMDGFCNPIEQSDRHRTYGGQSYTVP